MIRSFFSLFQTLGHSLLNNLNNGEKNITITKSSIFFSFYGRRRSSDGKIFVVFLVWLILFICSFLFRDANIVALYLYIFRSANWWIDDITLFSPLFTCPTCPSCHAVMVRILAEVCPSCCVCLVCIWFMWATHYLRLHNSYSLRMLSTHIDIRKESGKVKYVYRKMKLEPCTVDGIM